MMPQSSKAALNVHGMHRDMPCAAVSAQSVQATRARKGSMIILLWAIAFRASKIALAKPSHVNAYIRSKSSRLLNIPPGLFTSKAGYTRTRRRSV